MIPRVLSVLAGTVTLTLSLACGGGGSGSVDTGFAVVALEAELPDDAGMGIPVEEDEGATAAARPAALAPGGTPIERMCSLNLSCSCAKSFPSVEACVEQMNGAVVFGFREATASCFAALSCEQVCSDNPAGQACNRMMAEDMARIALTIQQNAASGAGNHDAMMNIINNMGSNSTDVVDQNGNKLYSY